MPWRYRVARKHLLKEEEAEAHGARPTLGMEAQEGSRERSRPGKGEQAKENVAHLVVHCKELSKGEILGLTVGLPPTHEAKHDKGMLKVRALSCTAKEIWTNLTSLVQLPAS
jgi:hypothetical protein